MYIFLFLLLALGTNKVESFEKRKPYISVEGKVSPCTTATTTTTTTTRKIITTTTSSMSTTTPRPMENHHICSNINVNNGNCRNHQPYRDCGFGIIQKIPYHDQTVNLMDIPFSSACIRCGLCLVIADKINKTLMDVHDAMSTDRWLNENEVDALFKMICDQSFLRYRLREIDNERYIGENLPGSIIIETTANDHWAPKLKIKCNELLEGISSTKLYKKWLECRDNNTNKNLATILCNGDTGILRDCRSITDAAYYPKVEESFHAGVKVKAAFHCIG